MAKLDAERQHPRVLPVAALPLATLAGLLVCVAAALRGSADARHGGEGEVNAGGGAAAGVLEPLEPNEEEIAEAVDNQFDWIVLRRWGFAEIWINGIKKRPPVESLAKERVESAVRLRVADAARNIELTAEQRSALELAGEGEIDRLMNSYRGLRERWRSAFRGEGNQHELRKEARALALEIRGAALGSGSLFAKSLQRTLAPEQLAIQRTAEEERARYARRAAIAKAVAYVEETIPLRAEKRERLLQLLEQSANAAGLGGADLAEVLRCFSKIADGDLEEVFDTTQMRNFRRFRQEFEMHALVLEQF
ncbi:MAG: hypothetical protein L0Z55_13020 [Planctomycetes bacterium]|nr:hypothetical protein [Planctomycetota bacterium]